MTGWDVWWPCRPHTPCNTNSKLRNNPEETKTRLQVLLQFISSRVHQLSVVPMVNQALHPVFGNLKLVLEEELVPIFRRSLRPIIVGWRTHRIPVLEPMVRICIIIGPILHQNRLYSFNGS